MSAAELRRAEALDVDVWRLGRDLPEVDGALARWMRERGVDFALVRPDRVIFSAGRITELPRALAALARGLGVSDGPAPEVPAPAAVV